MGIGPPKHLHPTYWDKEELHMKFAVMYDYRKKCLRRYKVFENDCGAEYIWLKRTPVLLSETNEYSLEFLGYGGRGHDEEQQWLKTWVVKQEDKREKQKRKAIWTWGTDETDAHSEELKSFADWRRLYEWVQWIYRHPEYREKYPEEAQVIINKFNNHPITLKNQEEDKKGGGT